MNSKDSGLRIEAEEENSAHPESKNIPKECEIFIKEVKNAKIVPIDEELDSTMNHNACISIRSKKLTIIKNKLLSFTSTRMVTVLNSRWTFIRNVFLLIAFQSLISLIAINIASSNENISRNLKKSKVLIIISSSILGLLGFAMLFYRRIFHLRVIKWILLTIFIIAKSYVSAYIASSLKSPGPNTFFIILGGTFFALVIYSIHSKEKFNIKSANFIVFLSCSFCSIICFAIYYKYFYTIIIVYIIVLLFIWFVVYDIQVIAGGRFKEFTYDDYVPTSLIVYVEIIGILFYIRYLINSNEE